VVPRLELVLIKTMKIAIAIYLAGAAMLTVVKAQPRRTTTSKPTPVVANQKDPSLIAVDETNIYWVTDSGSAIKRVSKSGGNSPVTILAGQKEIRELAVAGQRIYFVSADGVESIGTNGGTQATRIKANTYADSNKNLLAVDDSNVYFVMSPARGGEQIAKVEKTGGEPAMMASGIYAPNGLVSDGASLYWASYADGTIGRASLQDGRITAVGHSVSGRTCMDIAVDETSVYAACDSDILKFSKTGGVPVKLETIKPGFIKLEIDETDVWVLNYDRTRLYKISKNGGRRSELVAEFSPFRVKSFALDATNIYWTDMKAGAIMSLRK
jgi:hypothetical protein